MESASWQRLCCCAAGLTDWYKVSRTCNGGSSSAAPRYDRLMKYGSELWLQSTDTQETSLTRPRHSPAAGTLERELVTKFRKLQEGSSCYKCILALSAFTLKTLCSTGVWSVHLIVLNLKVNNYMVALRIFANWITCQCHCWQGSQNIVKTTAKFRWHL